MIITHFNHDMVKLMVKEIGKYVNRKEKTTKI